MHWGRQGLFSPPLASPLTSSQANFAFVGKILHLHITDPILQMLDRIFFCVIYLHFVFTVFGLIISWILWIMHLSLFMQYVFSEGKMNIERLKQLVDLVGKHRLVLDLSCRKKVPSTSDIFFSNLINSLLCVQWES